MHVSPSTSTSPTNTSPQIHKTLQTYPVYVLDAYRFLLDYANRVAKGEVLGEVLPEPTVLKKLAGLLRDAGKPLLMIADAIEANSDAIREALRRNLSSHALLLLAGVAVNPVHDDNDDTEYIGYLEWILRDRHMPVLQVCCRYDEPEGLLLIPTKWEEGIYLAFSRHGAAWNIAASIALSVLGAVLSAAGFREKDAVSIIFKTASRSRDPSPAKTVLLAALATLLAGEGSVDKDEESAVWRILWYMTEKSRPDGIYESLKQRVSRGVLGRRETAELICLLSLVDPDTETLQELVERLPRDPAAAIDALHPAVAGAVEGPLESPEAVDAFIAGIDAPAAAEALPCLMAAREYVLYARGLLDIYPDPGDCRAYCSFMGRSVACRLGDTGWAVLKPAGGRIRVDVYIEKYYYSVSLVDAVKRLLESADAYIIRVDTRAETVSALIETVLVSRAAYALASLVCIEWNCVDDVAGSDAGEAVDARRRCIERILEEVDEEDYYESE